MYNCVEQGTDGWVKLEKESRKKWSLGTFSIYKEIKVVGSGLIFSLQVGRDELLLHVGCVRAGHQQK